MAAGSWVWGLVVAAALAVAVLVLRLILGKRAEVRVVKLPGGKLKVEVRHVPKDRR